MSDSRSLLVLFGSQSGNAEDMASQVGKAASKYGLEAIVKGCLLYTSPSPRDP